MKERIELSHAPGQTPDTTAERAEKIEIVKDRMHTQEDFESLEPAQEVKASVLLHQAVGWLQDLFEGYGLQYKELSTIAELPIYKSNNSVAAYLSPTDVFLIDPAVLESTDDTEVIRLFIHEVVHAWAGFSLRFTQDAEGNERVLRTIGLSIGIIDQTIDKDANKLVNEHVSKLKGFNEGFTDLITYMTLLHHFSNTTEKPSDDVLLPLTYKIQVNTCIALLENIALHRQENQADTFKRWLEKYRDRNFLVFREVTEVFGPQGLELIKAMGTSDPEKNVKIMRYFQHTCPESERQKIHSEIFGDD